MKELETLHGYPMTDGYGNCYGIQPPTNNEMVNKINELVEVVNSLQRDIDYLSSQDEKRKKYKVIRRYDVLLLAKQKMESDNECLGLCLAIGSSLKLYGIDKNVYEVFPLYNRDKAIRFGAKDNGSFWWKPGKFGILSGRRRYLNYLIRKYKNNPEILNTIEIYD